MDEMFFPFLKLKHIVEKVRKDRQLTKLECHGTLITHHQSPANKIRAVKRKNLVFDLNPQALASIRIAVNIVKDLNIESTTQALKLSPPTINITIF